MIIHIQRPPRPITLIRLPHHNAIVPLLGEEDLTDVAEITRVGDEGAVGGGRPGGADHEVRVDCSAGVEAWVDGGEGDAA